MVSLKKSIKLDIPTQYEASPPMAIEIDGVKVTDLVDVAQVVHHVFGRLIQLAGPVVKHYHSDLYHDSVWLAANVTGNRFEFWFSFNESGTHIGTDSEYVVPWRVNAYHVTVELRPNRFGNSAYISLARVMR